MEKIKNIGAISEQWLRAVGVNSLAELEARGAVEVYKEILMHGAKANLNLLYSLEAAIQGVDWRKLTEVLKMKLRNAAR